MLAGQGRQQSRDVQHAARRPQGGHAEGQGRGTGGLREGFGDDDVVEARPGGAQIGHGREFEVLPGAREHRTRRYLHVQQEPIGEGRCAALVGVHALVEGDHAEPGLDGLGHAFARQAQAPVVEHRRELSDLGARQLFDQGQQDHAAVGFREQAPGGDGPPPREGRGEVEATEQAVVADAERNAPPGLLVPGAEQ